MRQLIYLTQSVSFLHMSGQVVHVAADVYVAACRGGLNVLLNNLPNIPDDYFAFRQHASAYPISYQGSNFTFGMIGISNSRHHAYSGMTHGLELEGWMSGTRDFPLPGVIYLRVDNPVASNAANKSALAACVTALTSTFPNPVNASRDARQFVRY